MISITDHDLLAAITPALSPGERVLAATLTRRKVGMKRFVVLCIVGLFVGVPMAALSIEAGTPIPTGFVAFAMLVGLAFIAPYCVVARTDRRWVGQLVNRRGRPSGKPKSLEPSQLGGVTVVRQPHTTDLVVQPWKERLVAVAFDGPRNFAFANEIASSVPPAR